VAAVDRKRFETRAAAIVGSNRVHPHFELAPVTTFRLGGPADWYIQIRSVEELLAVLAAARDASVPVTVLGGGSNVIVSDRGVPGAVIRLQLTGIAQPAADRVRAEAGVSINGLVRWTIAHGLAGLEAWAGTPGTVGGAVFGNAHYGGANIGDLVTDLMLVSARGETMAVRPDDMEFTYDMSRLRRTHEIVLWAEFAVGRGDPAVLRRRARESLAYRKHTQPLAVPSAGCIFQNPDPTRDALPDGVPASAGALVDRAGLKGVRVGGARISEKHANFIVNDGDATARDVRVLVEMARAAVRERFGVHLRDEVVYLGEF
jgi:UDP-N-acetylmuramate dehydrogenase